MRDIKFRVWDNINKRYYRSVLIYSCLEVEQYTGLKDKNGVEIYENDVVMWRDGDSIRYAQVAFTPDIKFLTCGYVFIYGRFAYKDTENHLTVIGNIHENADLLE